MKLLLPLSILASTAFVGVSAFPWMASPELRAAHDAEVASQEKRGLVDGLAGGLAETLGAAGGLLDGLLGIVATGVDPSNKRPDAAHPFKAPGPTDQRGVCPGLNLLANHGYLPRNGIVNAGQVIAATKEGFNMAEDLSGLLVLIGTAFGGNLATETFSIGGEDDRTYSATGIGSKAFGRQYGLNGHSRCEGDVSALREDFYLNNGDNHNAHPDRFKRFIELAKQNGGQFNLNAANSLYAQNARESIAKNDKLYFQAYTIVVILGEYPFMPEFFSNGTYGRGGVANYESLSSILGMKANKDGSICYVPERFPDNWYRRSTEYGVASLVAGLAPTYLYAPILPQPLGFLQNPAQLPLTGCAIYQGLTSGIPASLLGSTNDYISEVEKYVQRKLLPIFPPLYGCNPSEASLQGNKTDNGQYMTPTTGNSQQYSAICA